MYLGIIIKDIFKLKLKNHFNYDVFLVILLISTILIKYYRKGLVDVKAGLYMALLFMIFAYISSHYSIGLDGELLRKIFGIFTISAGFYILFSKEYIL